MPTDETPKRRRRQRTPTAELIPAPTPTLPVVIDSLDDQIATRMAESHPIYGAFGHVFRTIGGVDRLAMWAEDEPGKFYAIFSKMVPQDAAQNQINIQINAKLAPGPLDE